MDDPIIARDATSLAASLRSGELKAAEVAEAFLARIAERDASVLAWAHLDPALVRAQARALDARRERGPLHGVPVAIKDVIATTDMPTQYGSRLYQGHTISVDAACVRLLRQAGALILGKTATVELASIGEPPPTRNPHAPDRTPGGSSSGSAAAVADFQAPLALGTQTGGSIIRPASFCGTWALKPSWGTVSTEGVKPFAPSLDTIGWFGRSARDLQLVLDVLSPGTGKTPTVHSLGRARIGVWSTPGWPRAEASTRDALEAAVDRLLGAGAIVDPLPFAFPELAEDHLVIMHAEGQRSFLAEYRADPDRLHPRIAEMVRSGGAGTERVRVAHDRTAAAREAFDRAAGGYDAVIAPSTIGEAPPGLTGTGDLLFNGLMTSLHIPTVNLPLFRGVSGLPVGLTLTGPRGADARVLRVAALMADLLEAHNIARI